MSVMFVRRLSTKPSWEPMTTLSVTVRCTARFSKPRVSIRRASAHPSMSNAVMPPSICATNSRTRLSTRACGMQTAFFSRNPARSFGVTRSAPASKAWQARSIKSATLPSCAMPSV